MSRKSKNMIAVLGEELFGDTGGVTQVVFE
jgi:hypothetical protein